MVRCHGQDVGLVLFYPDLGAKLLVQPMRRALRRKLASEFKRQRREFMAGRFPTQLGQGFTLEEVAA